MLTQSAVLLPQLLTGWRHASKGHLTLVPMLLAQMLAQVPEGGVMLAKPA